MAERRPPSPGSAASPRSQRERRPAEDAGARSSAPRDAPPGSGRAPRASAPRKRPAAPDRRASGGRAAPPARRSPRSGDQVERRREERDVTAQREREASERTQRRGSAPWQRVNPTQSAPPSVSLRMRERLAERKKTERRRAASRATRVALIAAAVAVAVWAVAASPLFALDADKIEVSGVSAEIDAAAVTTVLASHDGESMITLNVPHVADQLRDLTGVRDATVERVWPQGLRVTLVPRHPVAAIPSGSEYVLMDADAVRVGTADAPPPGLPVVTVPLDDERSLNAAVTVIKSLPQDILDRVQGLGAQTEDSVTFTLADGPTVEWGSAEDSALKAQVLQVLLDSGRVQGQMVVDVSAPTLPITRAAG